MRSPITSSWLLSTWLAGAALMGCASKPVPPEPPAASLDRDCENLDANPLHLTGFEQRAEAPHDAAIDALLVQHTDDPRLADLNRRMYQTLHALDVELRREQRVAACKSPQEISSPEMASLVAQSRPAPTFGAAASAGVGTGSSMAGAVGGVAVTNTVAGASAPTAVAGSAYPGVIRRTSLSTSGGGNGATAQKVPARSDNDVVARRLRKAAEQEPDSRLRAKLWKEYTDYLGGASAK